MQNRADYQWLVLATGSGWALRLVEHTVDPKYDVIDVLYARTYVVESTTPMRVGVVPGCSRCLQTSRKRSTSGLPKNATSTSARLQEELHERPFAERDLGAYQLLAA